MWLYVINKVKVTHQGEGHIKVKVKYLHPFKFYEAHAFCKRVVCIRLKCYLLPRCLRLCFVLKHITSSGKQLRPNVG